MSDFDYLNKIRVRTGMFGSTPEAGFNGFFCDIIEGEKVKIIAGDGLGWQHVSVSLAERPKTTPRWSIMCRVKDLFWNDDEWVMQFHPAKADHVNFHEGCLHLWRPTDVKFPTPPSSMVGPKA